MPLGGISEGERCKGISKTSWITPQVWVLRSGTSEAEPGRKSLALFTY